MGDFTNNTPSHFASEDQIPFFSSTNWKLEAWFPSETCNGNAHASHISSSHSAAPPLRIFLGTWYCLRPWKQFFNFSSFSCANYSPYFSQWTNLLSNRISISARLMSFLRMLFNQADLNLQYFALNYLILTGSAFLLSIFFSSYGLWIALLWIVSFIILKFYEANIIRSINSFFESDSLEAGQNTEFQNGISTPNHTLSINQIKLYGLVFCFNFLLSFWFLGGTTLIFIGLIILLDVTHALLYNPRAHHPHTPLYDTVNDCDTIAFTQFDKMEQCKPRIPSDEHTDYSAGVEHPNDLSDDTSPGAMP